MINQNSFYCELGMFESFQSVEMNDWNWSFLSVDNHVELCQITFDRETILMIRLGADIYFSCFEYVWIQYKNIPTIKLNMEIRSDLFN